MRRVHSWFNTRPQHRRLFYGRRMYELMAAYWPTAGSIRRVDARGAEFAQIWRDTPKVVFSSTLASVDWNGRLCAATSARS